MKTLALLLALSALPLSASAATVRQGAPGCMTAELLDQLIDAILKDDQQTGEGLLHGGGCIIVAQDVAATVLQTQDDKVQVKIAKGDLSLDMWVPAKYVEN